MFKQSLFHKTKSQKKQIDDRIINISMLSQHLQKYEDLKLIDPSQIPHISYVTYGELILDLTHFSHPGTNKVIENFLRSDIEAAFESKQHSMNAKLMVAHLSIGKTTEQNGKGYALFKQIQNSEMSKIHQGLMERIDFDSPLLPQLAKIDKKQQEAFITIPKFLNNRKLRFKQGKWEEFFYLDNFWYSHFVFEVVAIAMVSYLYATSNLFTSIHQLLLISVGIVKWTLLEYYFHRFDLHSVLQMGKVMNGHYIHHAFPGFRYKLALSFHRILIDQVAFFVVYHYLLGVSEIDSIYLILGLHLSLTLYDVLHYYFHFGPQLNIPILRELRKNHLKHHYRDPNKGFGVTNTFWDHVFGSQHKI